MVIEPFRGARGLIVRAPWICTLVADVRITETGGDRTQFPTAGHFASWAGTYPGSNESAGKVKSTTIRPRNKHIKGTLGVAAMSAARANGTCSSAKYWRIAARRGRSRVVVAVEHAMLVAISHTRTTGAVYTGSSGDHFAHMNPDKPRTAPSTISAKWATTSPSIQSPKPAEPQSSRQSPATTGTGVKPSPTVPLTGPNQIPCQFYGDLK